jgi:glutaredoxin
MHLANRKSMYGGYNVMPASEAGGGRGKKVVMYSAPWCAACKGAKRFFREKGIPFREMDIQKSRLARREFDRLNGRGVPLILVGDKRMNGFSPKSFMKLYR